MRAVQMLMVVAFVVLAGCHQYVPPGRGASMDAFGVTAEMKQVGTDGELQSMFDRKPLASFPVSVAVVRVQASGYTSRTAGSAYGQGAYSVLTTRDIETDADFERIGKLPMLQGVAPINRMMLSRTLNTDKELRMAAAALQAEMLLIYTVDTSFFVDDFARPLTVISLGMSPNRKARVYTTASAILTDTRSGYIYALAEASESQDQLANAWTDDSAVDQTRLRTERIAFEKLIGELEQAWPKVIARHATPPATQPTPATTP